MQQARHKAEVAFERQTDLIAKKVTSEANLDTARAKRDTSPRLLRPRHPASTV